PAGEQPPSSHQLGTRQLLPCSRGCPSPPDGASDYYANGRWQKVVLNRIIGAPRGAVVKADHNPQDSKKKPTGARPDRSKSGQAICGRIAAALSRFAHAHRDDSRGRTPGI